MAAIAYLPGVVSPTIAGRWAILAVGAALCLTTIQKLTLDCAHAFALAILLWACASVFWSASPLDTIGECWHWLILFAVFLAASQYNKPDNVLFALCLGLCVSLPFVLFQLQGVSPVLATDTPAGLFLSRNALGELSAVALVWALARGRIELAVPMLGLALLSGSRGAVLAAGIGGAYLIWPLFGWKGRTLGLLGAFIGLGALIWLRPESALMRLDIWALTLRNLTFLGRGLESFAVLAPQYEFVHNDPLQLVFELGIGSALALPIIFRATRYRSPEAAALLALAGASLVSFPLHHPLGAALMASLSGLAVGACYRAERAEHISRAVRAARFEYEGAGSPAGV